MDVHGKTQKRMQTIVNKVASLLSKDKNLRNDDTLLVSEYWNIIDGYKNKLPSTPITSPESIIRARRKLQAKGDFLPTDPQVIIKRRKREVAIRKWART